MKTEKQNEKWVLETLTNRPIFCNEKNIYTEFRLPGFSEMIQFFPTVSLLRTAEQQVKLPLRWRKL